MTITRNHRDDNEAEFVSIWERFGCLWIPLQPGTGFDGLLVCPRTGLHAVEIKREGKFKMTDRERKVCDEMESRGGVYSIIQTEKQALQLIGMEAE